MRKAWNRKMGSLVVAIILTVAMVYLGVFPGGQVWGDSVDIDESASDWAVPSLQQAYQYGLTYPEIMNHFTKPINREEFCTIAVKLYQKLTGKTVSAGTSPFADTSNQEIIKAYQLGIVKGTGAGRFSPYANISRQEISVMIFRTLEKAFPNLDKTTGDFPFGDKALVADWALNEMKFAYKNQIMQGVGGGKIDPLSNTTREQGITLIKRTYEKYSQSKAIVMVGESPIIKFFSEKDKFRNINFAGRLSTPKYNTKIQLMVSNQAGRPTVKPVKTMALPLTLQPKVIDPVLKNPDAKPDFNPEIIKPDLDLSKVIKRPVDWLKPRPTGPVYTAAPYSALIDAQGDKKRWFAYTLKKDILPANIVWQVATAPYNGFDKNWKKPNGLVSTGQVAAGAGEFMIDFGTFADKKTVVRTIPRAQTKYYVRSVPVDSRGNCLGDPGDGIAVLYGKPLPSGNNGDPEGKDFELWAPNRLGTPQGGGPDNNGYSGEFPNKMLHDSLSRGYDCSSKAPLWFLFHGFDVNTTKVVMQVSTEPFAKDYLNWETPKGLAYSKVFDKLPVKLDASFENAVPIIFSSFGPPKSALKADEYVPYYVRAVAVEQGNTPGTIDASFSEVIKVDYGYPKPINIFPVENVTVKSFIPTVKLIKYQPIRWETEDWEHHYLVFREPKWNEITCSFKNVKTGYTLLPYYSLLWNDPTLTPDRYEKEIIPKALVKGTKVTIVDNPDNKSWWEDLWDGIVNFFKDIVNIVKELTNWVSNAYNNLKTGLIKFVADNFPGIPSGWRAGLQKALEALVNGGLAALGIPPTLPNFDQLTGQSLDYLAEVALTQAGIPADQITKDLVKKTAEGIGEEVAKSTATTGPNPIDSPFLKADPDFLYRPASMEIELRNDYALPTLPGSLNVDAQWEWKEEISLDHEVWSQLPVNQQYADALTYMLHFVYGLSRGHSGYPIYYPVFEPLRGQPIPILQPGEKRRVTIYLKEYVGRPYPFAINGEAVEWEDFAHLYWGDLGNVNFRVGTDRYSLPDPKAAALAQGFKPEPEHIYNYYYDQTSSGSVFDALPCQSYQ